LKNNASKISGRRIHFAGSADPEVEPQRLRYFHRLVKNLAKRTLAEGGGLVVTVGSEPTHQTEHDLPLIFDWTLLEAIDESLKTKLPDWPESQGAPIIAVGLPRWKDKMPRNRKPLWERLVSTENVELVQIRSELSIGGILRERQATFGDVLVTAGGGPGVEHLAQLYMSTCKPVIPLDIKLRTKTSSAEGLATRATENPGKFFDYKPAHHAAAAFSALSLRDRLPKVEEFEKKFSDFLFHLRRPRAFFARLLNKKLPEFSEVERFFRDVVDHVVQNAGYERFEMGKEASREPFLNVEVFQAIYSSSLTIVDLTGMRQDCLTELGYALGLGKKAIITAQEGTRLPFDSAALPCHFWSSHQTRTQRISGLKEFMKNNINRKPIVESM
jgi:hypothetical protein